MKLIVCLDDNNGMAFNHRRQSRDRVVIEQIGRLLESGALRMAPYSGKLFEGFAVDAREDYLSAAGPEDICFVELEDAAAYASLIDEITVYRWNRVYPADLHFGIDLSGWCLISSEELPGNSHEKITKEVYRR